MKLLKPIMSYVRLCDQCRHRLLLLNELIDNNNEGSAVIVTELDALNI